MRTDSRYVIISRILTHHSSRSFVHIYVQCKFDAYWALLGYLFSLMFMRSFQTGGLEVNNMLVAAKVMRLIEKKITKEKLLTAKYITFLLYLTLSTHKIVSFMYDRLNLLYDSVWSTVKVPQQSL